MKPRYHEAPGDAAAPKPLTREQMREQARLARLAKEQEKAIAELEADKAARKAGNVTAPAPEPEKDSPVFEEDIPYVNPRGRFS